MNHEIEHKIGKTTIKDDSIIYKVEQIKFAESALPICDVMKAIEEFLSTKELPKYKIKSGENINVIFKDIPNILDRQEIFNVFYEMDTMLTYIGMYFMEFLGHINTLKKMENMESLKFFFTKNTEMKSVS